MEEIKGTPKSSLPNLHPKMYLYRRIVLAKQFIDENYMKNIDLDAISESACLSKYHFLRQFKLAYGLSPHRYLTKVRIQAAQRAIRRGSKVGQACFAVGFESLPSFTHLFKKYVGVSPRTYYQRQLLTSLIAKKDPQSLIPSCFADRLADK